MLNIVPGNSVLDYGTGDGYMLLRLLEMNIDPTGFEPDDFLRAQAAANVELRGGGESCFVSC